MEEEEKKNNASRHPDQVFGKISWQFQVFLFYNVIEIVGINATQATDCVPKQWKHFYTKAWIDYVEYFILLDFTTSKVVCTPQNTHDVQLWANKRWYVGWYGGALERFFSPSLFSYSTPSYVFLSF